MRRAAAFGACTLYAAFAAPAFAAPALAVGGHVAFGADGQPGSTLLTLSPLVGVRLDPHADGGHAAWELWWGAVATGSSAAGWHDALVRAGNPWLSARVAFERPSFAWQLGAGATFPLARVERSDQGRLGLSTYNHAMGVRGLWNLWLWAPDALAVPLTAEGSYSSGDRATFGLAAAAAPLFRVRGGESTGARATVQGAATACLETGPGEDFARLCAWTQVVWLPHASPDRTQVAVGVRLVTSAELDRVFLAGLLNLDEPLGFDRGARLWGVFVGKEMAP